MFARVHTLETTPEQFERGLELVRDQLLPWARESTGFRGVIGLVSADRGEAFVVTLWADRDTLDASAEAGDRLSALAAETTGAVRRSLKDYEVRLFEISAEAEPAGG